MSKAMSEHPYGMQSDEALRAGFAGLEAAGYRVCEKKPASDYGPELPFYTYLWVPVEDGEQ